MTTSIVSSGFLSGVDLSSLDVPVVEALASFDPTPPDALKYFASFENDDIKSAVAAHRACPPDVLQSLAKDPSMWVAIKAIQNPGLPAAVASAEYQRLPSRFPGLDMRVVDATKHKTTRVRTTRPSTSLEQLQLLVNPDPKLSRKLEISEADPSTVPFDVLLSYAQDYPEEDHSVFISRMLPAFDPAYSTVGDRVQFLAAAARTGNVAVSQLARLALRYQFTSTAMTAADRLVCERVAQEFGLPSPNELQPRTVKTRLPRKPARQDTNIEITP